MRTQLHSFKFVVATIVLTSLASLVEAANITSTVAGGNWSATTTWVGGVVPVAGDDVTIASSAGGTTVTVDINTAACATLTVNSTNDNQMSNLLFNNGSVLTVSGDITIGGTAIQHGHIIMTGGGTLQVGGALTLGAGGVFTAGAGTVDYTGANPTITSSFIYQNLTFSGTGTAGTDGALNFRGDLLNTNGGTLNFGANNVIISGTTASQTIAGFSTTGTVSMTKTAGTATLFGGVNGGALTINGTGGTLDLGTGLTHTFTGTWGRVAGTLFGNSSVLQIGGNVSGVGGTFTAGTGTVEWNSGGAQSLANVSYFNLTLSNSGTKTIMPGTTVNGSLSLQGTTTTTGPAITYGPSSTLEYAGSSAQTSTNVEFPAANGPFNLKINNASGVTLHAARAIGGAVTFTSGILHTTLTKLLTFNAEATSSATTNTSFVNGPVRKIFDAAESFTFPIGVTGTGDEPLGISGAALNDDFTAQYIRSSATSLGPVTSPILNVSACDHWILTKNSVAAANVGLTLSWDANSPCNAGSFVTNPATLTIGHFNGTAWDEAGTSGSFTGDATAGTVTRNNVTVFSPFTLANTAANQNPLPVTFGNIKGFVKNGGIEIDWITYSEVNVDHYEIERSVNGGQQFQTIGQTAARNTNNQTEYGWMDATPGTGVNLYRIKSVDIDGKVSYSIIVKVNLVFTGDDILIYPNPTQNGYVSFQSSDLHKGTYTVKVINSGGQEIYRLKFEHQGGAFSQTITLPTGLKSGMYNLQLINGNEIKTKPFIVQ
ncbi:hypothetical protein C5B42_00060 [Candidatus Cerribacteria bacterium 'Amazon FNV 2010 28 9']|uniref:G8 domain-containing protein n=1 Tax=Candidatus Cerribacteria bacterium 'Amazon FNV 2010 28 9' TaxID=2081795 RepID=A0A317JR73_9BACT|nr:MAG: hypothetical protein C5B42_00060 [Candidatus Cerribacteria bacterium 'Amazon FNV 2010 28 9']